MKSRPAKAGYRGGLGVLGSVWGLLGVEGSGGEGHGMIGREGHSVGSIGCRTTHGRWHDRSIHSPFDESRVWKMLSEGEGGCGGSEGQVKGGKGDAGRATGGRSGRVVRG